MPFDQILCLLPPRDINCDVYLEIYNEDGSQSENCVNGLRCIGRYMHDHNLAFNEEISVQLVNQITKVKKIDEENYEVILEQFSLDPEDIGLKKIKSDSYSFMHDQEQIDFHIGELRVGTCQASTGRRPRRIDTTATTALPSIFALSTGLSR
mgnify:CR=1 FL=1